jgi:hypothetical protein
MTLPLKMVPRPTCVQVIGTLRVNYRNQHQFEDIEECSRVLSPAIKCRPMEAQLTAGTFALAADLCRQAKQTATASAAKSFCFEYHQRLPEVGN